jgi:type IV secretion system protein VirD4
MAARGDFNQQTDRPLRLPDRIDAPGLLVGWSLEAEPASPPWGFSFGSPEQTPSTGFLDPILLSGEGHLITIAPTGQGKGRCCIIPALLRHDGPVIVIDPKGENYAVTARHRRAMGQKVVLLDPFGVTGEPSDSFNPLDVIDAGSVESVDIATRFASSLADYSGPNPENAYWYQRATFLLTSLMLHACIDPDPSMRTFGNIRTLLREVAGAARDDVLPKSVSRCIEEIENSAHPIAREAASLLKSGAREGLASILSMTENGIGFLRGPQVDAAVSSTSFDLSAVTRGDPLSIYLVVPPHNLESHGRLLRLWLTSLLFLITRRLGRPKKSTLFLLDEAAQLGPLAELRQAVTLLRGYGVQTWSFWQDASQLQRLYPDDWPTIINNSAVIQCFGAQNQLAAEGMAELVALDPGAHLMAAERKLGEGMIRSSADRILALNNYEMALQIGGRPPVVARKPDYLSDPPFTTQFDDNPFHDPDRDIMPPPSARMKLHDAAAIEQPPPGPGPSVADLADVADPAAIERGKEDPYLLERLLALWRDSD